jgi:DNA-binding MarR family transcriptional regulator
MSDEAEIRYGPLDHLVGYQLRRAFLRSNQLFAVHTGEVGLAPGQFGVLKLIALNPGRSQREIAQAAGLDRSSLTQTLDQLTAKGWVERRPGPNRRTVSLVITAAGTRVCDAAEPRAWVHERAIRAGLSEVEAALLLDLLKRLAT